MTVWKGILLALLCSGCRIQPPEAYWIECFGEAHVHQIAASPRGVDAVGGNGDVYHYPGDFAVPWKVLQQGPAKRVGASPRSTYFLDPQGFVSVVRPGGAASRWDYSDIWQATAVAADEDDHVFVIAGGQAFRVKGMEIVPLACRGSAVAVSASRTGVYVVSPDGSLADAAHGCTKVGTPGAVTSVSAFGKRLAIVVGRDVFHRVEGEWRRLPHALRYRSTGKTSVEAAEVAVSENSIWMRDTLGDVFVLSEAS